MGGRGPARSERAGRWSDAHFLMACFSTTAGDGDGEGGHGHWPVYEAAEEGPRAGGGEKEAAGQRGKDGGDQHAQGDSHETGTRPRNLPWVVFLKLFCPKKQNKTNTDFCRETNDFSSFKRDPSRRVPSQIRRLQIWHMKTSRFVCLSYP